MARNNPTAKPNDGNSLIASGSCPCCQQQSDDTAASVATILCLATIAESLYSLRGQIGATASRQMPAKISGELLLLAIRASEVEREIKKFLAGGGA